MTEQQLDQQRADFMESLYRRSGRDDLPLGDPRRKTYTGLWDEFCADIAANFRDTDYAELHARFAWQWMSANRCSLISKPSRPSRFAALSCLANGRNA